MDAPQLLPDSEQKEAVEEFWRLRAAAPLRMPQLALPATGKGLPAADMDGLDPPSPGAPNPYWTSSHWRSGI